MWLQLQRAADSLRANGNVHVRLWQNAGTALRPLDQAQGIALEIVADAEKLQLLRVGQAVQVEVEHPYSPQLIGLDQGEGRALHRAAMPQPAQDAARQGGLAGTQVAMQIDHAPTAGSA